MKQPLKIVFIILLLAHAAFLGYYLRTAYEGVFERREIPSQHRAFTVDEGASLNEVLEALRAADLAPQPIHVRLALLVKSTELVVKKGTYALPERASTFEILTLFDEGRVQLHKITVPEGLDKWQTAELLGGFMWGDREQFQHWIDDPEPILDHDPEAQDLEGYLFPETYAFPESATPKEIVGAMVNLYLSRVEDYLPELERRGLTPRQWVTLASMVEEEAFIKEEATIIAGVFQNRIEKGMLLQCDPTIIYSLKREQLYKGKIYKSQIHYDSPYNTYVYKGLPPGPIASPGLHALEAALRPEETPYIFFVAQRDGSHYFSTTLAEHNRAVRAMRRLQ